MSIRRFLALAQQEWPTDKARHNLTLSDEDDCLEVTLFLEGRWQAIIVSEDEFDDPEHLIVQMRAALAERELGQWQDN